MRIIGRTSLLLLSLKALTSLTSVFAGIKLDFRSPNTDEPFDELRFPVSDLETNPTVENTKNSFKLITPTENCVIGASGSFDVHVSAKTGEDASAWHFTSNATLHQSRAGLGAVTEGDTAGRLQLTNGEAFLVTFHIGDLLLTPGAKLGFILGLPSSDDTVKVYQRTGVSEGTRITTTVPVPSEGGPETDMFVVIHEETASAPDKYEFAFVDAGWNGGGGHRLASLTIDVVGGTPVPEPPQLSGLDEYPTQQPTAMVVYPELPEATGIKLNFAKPSVNGAAPISDILFTVKDLASTAIVQSSSVGLSFDTPSFNKVIGAAGSLSIHLSAKSGGDISSWGFNSHANFTQVANGGLGVATEGDTGGKLQMTNGEFVLISLDTSDVRLTSGAKIVFSIDLANPDDTAKIYQRTDDSKASPLSTVPLQSASGASKNMYIVNSESALTSDLYEFVIANAGWNGGGPTRVKSLTINVLGGESLGQPPKLHPLFTDNMVLQRRETVPIYGTAAAGSVVAVSFGGQSMDVVADSAGFWNATLAPMEANTEAQTLIVAQGILSAKARNVLVGEVWVAGGQSNMDRPFWTYKTLDHKGKDNSNIRIVDIEYTERPTPTDDITISSNFGGSWQECEASVLRHFSPAAYYFAAKLEEEHGHSVPIGIIESTRGSSRAELWTSKEKLTSLGYSHDDYNSKAFNGMIYPLNKYTFRGVIFYQGESNANDRGEQYHKLFSGLIESWRNAFGRGDIPFYFAQLSTYKEPNWDQSDDNGWPFLRAAQAATLALPNTGMVVTYDAGEWEDIHPQDKETVGFRFAYHALALDGVGDFVGDSPEPLDFQLSGNQMLVTFGEPLETREVRINRNINLAPGTDPEAFVAEASTLEGFSVCGDDRVFVDANAVITNGNQVVVSSPHITAPKEVRYCWKTLGVCNLFSVNTGLPSVPFRSDDFVQPQMDGRLSGFVFSGDPSNPSSLLGGATEVSILANRVSTVESVSVYGIAAHNVISKEPGSTTARRVIYFKSTDPVIKDPARPYVLMRILCFDAGVGEIRFRHVTKSTNQNDFTESDVVLQDTGTWRVVEMILRDAVFDGRYGGGNDVRVEALNDFTIGGIYLSGVSSMFPIPIVNSSVIPTAAPIEVVSSVPTPPLSSRAPSESPVLASFSDIPSSAPMSTAEGEDTEELHSVSTVPTEIVSSVPTPLVSSTLAPSESLVLASLSEPPSSAPVNASGGGEGTEGYISTSAAPTAVTSSVPTPIPLPHITELKLVAAPKILSDGMVIDLGNMGISIIATVDDSTSVNVDSVKFVFQGNTYFRNEPPYAVEAAGITFPGQHTIEATPYTGVGGRVIEGEVTTLTFTVTDSRLQ